MRVRLQPIHRDRFADDRRLALLVPPMALCHMDVGRVEHLLVADKFPKTVRHILGQGLLVVFQGQEIIGVLSDDLLGNRPLAAHHVTRGQTARQIQFLE